MHDPDGDTGSQQVVNEYYMHDGSARIMYIVPDAWQSHFYMFNPATDEVLFSQTDGVYATLTDHLGTVHDLVNQNSTVVNHFVYDAFGNMVGGTAQVHWRNRIGFAGAFFEAATGLQYNHHRWYDPQAGRWISEDPLGFSADDPNLSRYVTNSPVIFSDPTGLQSVVGDDNLIARARELDEIQKQWQNSPPKIRFDRWGTEYWEWPDGYLQGPTGEVEIRQGFAVTPLPPGTKENIPSEPSTEMLAEAGMMLAGLFSNPTTAINVNKLRPTRTVANHIPTRPYINSPHTINNIINYRRPLPDPGGVRGALYWNAPGSWNTSQGTYHIVIDPSNNTILHYIFVSW